MSPTLLICFRDFTTLDSSMNTKVFDDCVEASPPPVSSPPPPQAAVDAAVDPAVDAYLDDQVDSGSTTTTPTPSTPTSDAASLKVYASFLAAVGIPLMLAYCRFPSRRNARKS